MLYNPITILLTILGLYAASYIAITLFTFIYLGFTRHAHEVRGPRVFLATAVAALGWVVTTFVALMLTVSFGIIVFSLIGLVLLFVLGYFVCSRMLGFKGKTTLLYAFLIAIIFNPGWLSLAKVL